MIHFEIARLMERVQSVLVEGSLVVLQLAVLAGYFGAGG